MDPCIKKDFADFIFKELDRLVERGRVDSHTNVCTEASPQIPEENPNMSDIEVLASACSDESHDHGPRYWSNPHDSPYNCTEASPQIPEEHSNVSDIEELASACSDEFHDHRPRYWSNPHDSYRKRSWDRSQLHERGDDNSDRWRETALKLFLDSRDVFVMEAHMKRHFLLKIKVSTIEETFTVTTPPWNTMIGKSVTKEEFEEEVGLFPTSHPTSTFSASRLVRFFLNHSRGVPIIVSSCFTDVFIPSAPGPNLMDHIIYNRPVPGNQTCHYMACQNIATAITTANINSGPPALFCSRHAPRDQDIKLYKPLLIALIPNKHNLVLSALNVGSVFGPRLENRLVSKNTRTSPCATPIHWTPISKIQHTDEIKFLSDCYSERNSGMNIRHSIVQCLVKHLINKGPTLCKRSVNRINEDYPLNWFKKRYPE